MYSAAYKNRIEIRYAGRYVKRPQHEVAARDAGSARRADAVGQSKIANPNAPLVTFVTGTSEWQY